MLWDHKPVKLYQAVSYVCLNINSMFAAKGPGGVCAGDRTGQES